MSNFGHCDTLDYFPLKDGIKPSQVGLRPLKYKDSRKNMVFQIDEHYDRFIENKQACMTERPSKYFRRAMGVNLSNVERYILDTMAEEYPDRFAHLKNLRKVWTFDELAMMVPEDMVVHCFNDERDWAEAIHLCHANGWSAEEQLNWTFDQIHADVPRMKEIIHGDKVKKMMKGMVKSGRVLERIAAISFRTDSILNRHPKAGVKHLPFDLDKNANLFIRFERQTVKGFDKVGFDVDSPSGFLFTIRTYFVDVSKLEGEYLQRVVDAFENPDPKIYSYEFIKKYQQPVLEWIKRRK